MDVIHDVICGPCAQNPKRSITYSWLLSLVLILCAFIAGCVAASRIETNDTPRGYGFAIIWTVLTAIGLSVGGTYIMRRLSTAYYIGLLLGMVSLMSMLCLIISAIFAGRADLHNNSDEDPDIAVAIFLFFLFIVYAVFSIMLAVFRDEVISKPALADTMKSGGPTYPPSNVETETATAEPVDSSTMPPSSV